MPSPTINPRTCSVDGCDRPHRARGWCKLHWGRERNHGSALWQPRVRPQHCKVEGCDKPVRVRDWCAMHYGRWQKHGDPLKLVRVNTGGEVARFLEEVVLRHDSDECLIWPFARNTGGYGHMRWQGRLTVVNRLVCILKHGPPPSPTHVAAYTCLNGRRGCVNPNHVEWKTPAQNSADDWQRRRRMICPQGECKAVVSATDALVRSPTSS